MERIPIANRPKGLALSGDQVWFAVQASGAGHRGGRLVVGRHGLIQGSIDPSFIELGRDHSPLSTAYDGLVGPARRGGSEGTQIVPNLAVSLPVHTAGGTRYAFQLRRGIRYSDGTLVKASDFRRAFERALRARLPWDSSGLRSWAPTPARASAADLRSQPGHPDGRCDRDDRLPPPAAGQTTSCGILMLRATDPAWHARDGTRERVRCPRPART